MTCEVFAPQPKRQRTVAESDTTSNRTDGTPNSTLTPAVMAATSSLEVETWTPRAKYLISKMRLLRFIDEFTPDYLVKGLAKTADKLYIYAGFGKTGDAAALLRRIHVGHTLIDQVLNADYADLSNNCSESNERENKDIYWTFASAFLICFFEVKAKKQFRIQYYHPSQLVEQFLKMYPAFQEHNGLTINRLLTYHLCMQVAVSAFSRGVASEADSVCLLELTTRMTEGRELALACCRPDNQMMALLFGGASTAAVSSCRKVIFETIIEIKRNPAEKADVTRPKRNVRFAEENNTYEPANMVVSDEDYSASATGQIGHEVDISSDTTSCGDKAIVIV